MTANEAVVSERRWQAEEQTEEQTEDILMS